MESPINKTNDSLFKRPLSFESGEEATAAQYLPSDLVFKANKGISLARRVCLKLRSRGEWRSG